MSSKYIDFVAMGVEEEILSNMLILNSSESSDLLSEYVSIFKLTEVSFSRKLTGVKTRFDKSFASVPIFSVVR